MAQNYKYSGDVLNYTVAGAAAESGKMVLLTDIVGVALNSGAIGETISVAFCGVFEVDKAAGAITQGQKLYYDAAAKKLTATATSNTFAGYAAEAAANGDAKVLVKLLG